MVIHDLPFCSDHPNWRLYQTILNYVVKVIEAAKRLSENLQETFTSKIWGWVVLVKLQWHRSCIIGNVSVFGGQLDALLPWKDMVGATSLVIVTIFYLVL